MSTEREPKPKHPIPWWGYLFAEVCGIIPLLTLGGAIPGAIGVGGAARCLAIARDPAKSVAILVGVCTGMSAVCWALFAVLRDSRIASQSKTARTGSIARSKHWKWGLLFELPARINQSTLTPRIMADIANKYPESVAGKFYVDNQCIDCDLCRETAPNNFKRNDDGGYSFVYKQPGSPEEEAQCKEAKEGCPVEAIGDNGDQA